MTDTDNAASVIQAHLTSTVDALRAIDGRALAAIARSITDVLRAGGTVYAAGNGGSAAQAQHLVGELAGRFSYDRPGLRAIALGTDTVSTSAISNDFGQHEVFARQLLALARPGDLVVALSTSGASTNVLEMCRRARRQGLAVVSFVGPAESPVAVESDMCFAVPGTPTAIVQEVHLVAIHLVCSFVDTACAGINLA